MNNYFLILLSVLLLTACDDEPNRSRATDVMTDQGIRETELTPVGFRLTASTACTLSSDCIVGQYCYLGYCAYQCLEDNDCSTGSCDDRGRCAPGIPRNTQRKDNEAVDPQETSNLEGIDRDQLGDINIETYPLETQYVSPGQNTITLQVITNADATLYHGFTYRVDSTVENNDSSYVYTSDASTIHTITLPTGRANPEVDEPQVEHIYITSSAGSFPIRLIPARAADGEYNAELSLRGLYTKIPFNFSLITEPSGLGLEPATPDEKRVYLVLGSKQSDLFIPTTPTEAPDSGVKVECFYKEPIESWSCSTISAFNLAQENIFGEHAMNQVRRNILMEFSLNEQGMVEGTLSDRWNGLVDQYNSSLEPELKGILIEGDFVAHWNKTLSLNSTEVMSLGPDQSSPQILGLPERNDCDTIFAENCDVLEGYDAKLACFRTLSSQVLNEDSLSTQVASLFDDSTTTTGENFTGFLELCADDMNETCQTPPEVKCALHMTAKTLIETPLDDQATYDELWITFSKLLTEYTGGPQLIAFYNDVQTRKDLLTRGEFEVPSIAEEALAELNEAMLNKWMITVVDGSLIALRRFMQIESFVFLNSVIDSDTARDERDRLLISLVTAWTHSASNLALATKRWNELFRLTSQRKEKAEEVAIRLRELYISALVIIDIHIRAGKGAEAAPIAQGLSQLSKNLIELSQDFNTLLFSRDGEFFVSTDPRETLEALKDNAELRVSEASENIQSTLADIFQQQFNTERRRSAAVIAIGDSEGRLRELCGVPTGCNASNIGIEPNCDSSWEIGLCGFTLTQAPVENRSEQVTDIYDEKVAEYQMAVQEREACLSARVANADYTINDENEIILTTDTSSSGDDCENISVNLDTSWRFEPSTARASEAGIALLEILKADTTYRNVQAELLEFKRVTIQEAEQLIAFVNYIKDVEQIHSNQIDRIKAEQQYQETTGQEAFNIRTRGVSCITGWKDNKDAPMPGDCKCGSRDCDSKGKAQWWRETRKTNLDKWQTDRDSNNLILTNYLRDAANARSKAEGLRDVFNFSAQGFSDILATLSLDLPNVGVGTGIAAASTIVNGGLTLGAMIQTNIAEKKAYYAEKQAIVNEAYLEKIIENQEFVDLSTEFDITVQDLQGEIAILESDLAIQKAENAIELIQMNSDFAKELAEMLFELEERRLALFRRVSEEYQQELDLLEADLDIQLAVLNYIKITEDADQERGTLVVLRSQLEQFNNLVAGAQAFLTMSSQLAQAERQLIGAKDALLDWLTALEYHNVRPFFNERIAIRLAKSSYELKAISDRLADLTLDCNGISNNQSIELSLRNDLLKLKDTIIDSVTSETLTPQIRLIKTLERGIVPIGMKVRYSATQNIGELLNQKDVLSTTFSIKLSELANLPISCNAKLSALAIKLVGQGFENQNPALTILYEGASQLYSCHPNIQDYVDYFGQDMTRYGTVTTIDVSGRNAGLVLGINEFGSSNITFRGLPVSSRYTLVIDPSLPANAGLPWENLEDLEILLEYTYQDLYPSDSICGQN